MFRMLASSSCRPCILVNLQMATLAVQEATGMKVDREAVATLVLPQLWAMSMGPCKYRNVSCMFYLLKHGYHDSAYRITIQKIHGSHPQAGRSRREGA